jgi:hypothetical protein
MYIKLVYLAADRDHLGVLQSFQNWQHTYDNDNFLLVGTVVKVLR